VGIGRVYFGTVEGEHFDGEATGAVVALVIAIAFFEILLLVVAAVVTEASAEEDVLFGLGEAFSRGIVESQPFNGLIVVETVDETDANGFLLPGFVSDPACTD